MKILFAWRQYNQMAGGVERTSIELMNEMCARGHEIHLVSWDNADAKPYYTMDERINWFKIDCGDSSIRANFFTRLKRILIIRNLVKDIKPDVVLAYMDGIFLAVKVSILGLGIPVIEAERCAISRFKFIGSPLKTAFILHSLRMAKKITVQLESYREQYPKFLWAKILPISNPVKPAVVYANTAGEQGGGKKILLSVGRLAYQKNYTLLINSFSQIAKDFPDWNLIIVGGGDEKEALESLIEDKKMRGRIILQGEMQNVEALYQTSNLFCLPSRWEGFPNSLAEALSHGLPCIGLKDCAGVNDLIIHHSNGLLSTPETLELDIARLMKDSSLRQRMGVQAIASVQKYAPEKIFDQWESLFFSFNNH